MAEPPGVAEQALRKLEDQLTCGICLDSYTDPKLLQCFHVFCKQCLERLVVQDHQGLSLCCPNCRRSTLLPPASVSGLPTAFYLNHLFEVRDTLEKVKEPEKTQCEKCKKRTATNFCRNCGKFICVRCTETHQEWEEFSSHEVITLHQLEGDITRYVPPMKKVMFCSKHPSREVDLYCETCQELLCRDCILRLHRDHQYDLVTDVFWKYKEVLVSSLQPVEQQLGTVAKSLQQFDTRYQQITDQWEALVAEINTTIRQLQEALEVRKTELVDQLDQITRQKLKVLGTQRDRIELVQTQLNSCLHFMKESLKTSSEGEILALQKSVLKQIGEITADFKPDSLTPQEKADMRFSANTHELTQTFLQLGCVSTHPVSPERCHAAGKGLEVAVIGEQATAILYAIDSDGKECEEPLIRVKCELVSSTHMSSITTRCTVRWKQWNQYEINYQPTHSGRHQLHIKVEGVPIRGSPFAIVAVRKFATPIKTIGGVSGPRGVAINQRGDIIVAECNKHCVSIFNPSGKKIRAFGTAGSGQGQFNSPHGVAVDRDGNLLVVSKDCIQKFTAEGVFIAAVNKQLKFDDIAGIGIDGSNKVFVCDYGNCRIQVLNADLTFSSTFGSCRGGDGQFFFPLYVTFDSKGNVYVTDIGNHCIQVFTADGRFLRKLGKKDSGDGRLNFPTTASIDSDDVMYVTEYNCVSMFTCEGQFLGSFGTKGNGPGQFNDPCGIAMDGGGHVYVSDSRNNRIQIF